MKFDFIIGNPPYQESDGGAKSSSIPIYNKFVDAAKTLNPEGLEFIIPARWFSGGKGLDDFRDGMLNDRRICHIVDYFDSTDCFPSMDISGGVCIVSWKKNYAGDCEIESHRGNTVSKMKRPLLENDGTSFIRFNEAVSIIRKVKSKGEECFADGISARKPFGLATNVHISKEKTPGFIPIYAYPENGYYDRNEVPLHTEWIDKCKVCISYAYGERGNFPYQVIGKPFICEEGSCCTETYLVVAVCDSKDIAESIISYMKTRLFRFLVLLQKNTQHATKTVYKNVPVQTYDRIWTDEELYKKYNISAEEIDFINSMIKPMN